MDSLTKEQAENYAQELVKLAIDEKGIKERIKSIKGGLLEFSDLEGLDNHVWMCDNGYVQIETNTKYKLAEIPSTFEVDPSINVPVPLFEK